MDSTLIIVGVVLALWVCVICVGLLAHKARADKERAREALQDYMWCKSAREFFGVDTKDRFLKKQGVVFDDYLEEEHARLISSRVL